MPDHLPDMIDGCREKKENEDHCCRNRRIIMIQLEAGLSLLFRHLIGFLLTSEGCDRPRSKDVSNKDDVKDVCNESRMKDKNGSAGRSRHVLERGHRAFYIMYTFSFFTASNTHFWMLHIARSPERIPPDSERILQYGSRRLYQIYQGSRERARTTRFLAPSSRTSLCPFQWRAVQES